MQLTFLESVFSAPSGNVARTTSADVIAVVRETRGHHVVIVLYVSSQSEQRHVIVVVGFIVILKKQIAAGVYARSVYTSVAVIAYVV